ncbi:MAG: PilZ domain-containing protein [Candidatus Omnitrophica bacterium]|nr:PilZ domain-containing protein [Candidatus Omnitrophota bacterium]
MDNIPAPEERREFTRFDYATPLAYKVCKKETLTKLLKGYTSNISPAGLLCNVRETVNPEDVLWLSFDRGVLSVCAELEKRVFIYQNGIIGKVVRVEAKGYDNYDVGIKFLTREEQNFVKQSLGEDGK